MCVLTRSLAMCLLFSEAACVSSFESCHPVVLPKDHAAYDWIAGSLPFRLFAVLAVHQLRNAATTDGQRAVSLWTTREVRCFGEQPRLREAMLIPSSRAKKDLTPQQHFETFALRRLQRLQDGLPCHASKRPGLAATAKAPGLFA
jgi:hypothetical protein